jgi:hypothetical protein
MKIQIAIAIVLAMMVPTAFGQIAELDTSQQAQKQSVQPVQEQPAQPVQEQPAQTQPAQTQPAQTQPAQTQPAQTQPAQTQPAQTQPVQQTKIQPVQCVDFNQDKICEYVVLANGTMIANPILKQQPNPLYKFYVENEIKKTVEKDGDDNKKDDDDKKKTGNDCWEGTKFIGIDKCDTHGLPLCEGQRVPEGATGCFDANDFPQTSENGYCDDGTRVNPGEECPGDEPPEGDGCDEYDDYCDLNEGCESPDIDCIDDVNIGDDGEDVNYDEGEDVYYEEGDGYEEDEGEYYDEDPEEYYDEGDGYEEEDEGDYEEEGSDEESGSDSEEEVDVGLG